MADYNLLGGVNAVASYGERWQVGFIGNYVFGDVWTVSVTTTAGDMTLGLGYLAGLLGDDSVACTFKNRVYLGLGSQFNFSDVSDPTQWEEQSTNSGAGFQPFLSNLGSQDIITAFGQFQGRLAVFGQRSIQLWTTDADPAQFILVQNLDNIGTTDPLSVLNVGDADVLFLDRDTGVRSLRVLETTLNTYPSDVGVQVDNLIHASLAGYNSKAVGAVDPQTKAYWLYVNGVIYVLSRFQGSGISAWSTFIPRANNGALFAPEKFVSYQGRLYCRGTNGEFITYGGANGRTYDPTNSPLIVQIPWMDDKRPDLMKQIQGMNFVLQGKWKVQVSTDPNSQIFNDIPVYEGGDANAPSSKDSTYDSGRIPFEAYCTHFTLLATSANQSITVPPKLSSMAVHYNKAEVQ